MDPSLGTPPAGTPQVDRRFAVAGVVLGFGLGLAIGLKLAGGMEQLEAKVIEVPVRTPCRDCADRARRAAATGSDAIATGVPATAPPPDPVVSAPASFSPLAGAMVTNGDSSVPDDADPSVPLG